MRTIGLNQIIILLLLGIFLFGDFNKIRKQVMNFVKQLRKKGT